MLNSVLLQINTTTTRHAFCPILENFECSSGDEFYRLPSKKVLFVKESTTFIIKKISRVNRLTAFLLDDKIHLMILTIRIFLLPKQTR